MTNDLSCSGIQVLIILVAYTPERVIGNQGKIPWHLPEDIKHFKERTEGQVVIMGRKTWESLPAKFRPLPNRVNIVCSSTYHTDPDKFMASFGYPPVEEPVYTVPTFAEASHLAETLKKEVYVIGGSQIYQAALDAGVSRVLVSELKDSYEGDAYFPELEGNWSCQVVRDCGKFTIIEYSAD